MMKEQSEETKRKKVIDREEFDQRIYLLEKINEENTKFLKNLNKKYKNLLAKGSEKRLEDYREAKPFENSSKLPNHGYKYSAKESHGNNLMNPINAASSKVKRKASFMHRMKNILSHPLKDKNGKSKRAKRRSSFPEVYLRGRDKLVFHSKRRSSYPN